MAKKQKSQSPRDLTRRQIARAKREQEQVRLIYMGLGLVIALSAIVLGFGLYQTYVLEPQKPIAVVDGHNITTRDYQNRVRYERFMLDDQLQRIQQQLAVLGQSGSDDQLSQFLAAQYQQLATQVVQRRSTVDRDALDTMIDDVLVAEEANRRGITVSEEEITEYIHRFLAREQGGLTASAATATATARAEATATAAVWTPTPTFTPSPTLTVTEEITATPTPVETPTPQPTPTFNIISEDALQTAYAEWLKTLSDQVGISEAQYRQIVRTFLLRQKLQQALAEEVPTTAEHVHVRHILVETEEEAQKVLERLEAGEDFAELAKELSKDPGSAENGGDLGFVPKGSFVAEFENAAFSLPVGEFSQPVKTAFGYHIIQVLERGERELSPADYQRKQQLALNEWLTTARTAASIEDLWSADKVPPETGSQG